MILDSFSSLKGTPFNNCLEFLKRKELASLLLSSRSLNRRAQAAACLWQRLILTEFGQLPDDQEMLKSLGLSIGPLSNRVYYAFYQALQQPNGRLRRIGRALQASPEKLYALAVSRDGQLMVMGSRDKLSVWVKKEKRFVVDWSIGGREELKKIAISPKGNWFITVSNTVEVWMQKEKRFVLNQVRGYSGQITAVAISPKGNRFMTASNKTVEMWLQKKERFGKESFVLEQVMRIMDTVTDIAISSKGDWLAMCLRNKVDLWFKRGKRFAKSLSLDHPRQVERIVVSSTGQEIATKLSDDATACIWGKEKKSFVKKQEVKVNGGEMADFAFSPNGRQMLTTDYDGTVRVWVKKNGYFVLESVLKGHKTCIISLAVADNGQFVTVSDFRKHPFKPFIPSLVRVWTLNPRLSNRLTLLELKEKGKLQSFIELCLNLWKSIQSWLIKKELKIVGCVSKQFYSRVRLH